MTERTVAKATMCVFLYFRRVEHFHREMWVGRNTSLPGSLALPKVAKDSTVGPRDVALVFALLDVRTSCGDQ